MSDDALIRLENLRALGIGATELVKSVGSSYQYWRDLMAGNKSFGEKAARRIEEGVGLPRGSLDIPGVKPLKRLSAAPADQSGVNPPDKTNQPLAGDAIVPVAAKNLPSPDALMLAYWFDKIPANDVNRLRVHTAITQLIVEALQPKAANQPTHDRLQAETPETQVASPRSVP